MKKSILILCVFQLLANINGESDSNVSFLSKEQGSLLAQQKCSGKSEKFVNQCLQPILIYANLMQDDTNGAQFGLQGAKIFHKLCLLYHQFQECAKPTMCTSISVRAIEASYGYMCGRGYKLFEEHALCFSEVESQPEYIHCKHTAGRSMDDAAKYKNENVNVYFKKLCTVMNDYLQCCRPFVHEKCGIKAWQLIAQITMDSLQVTMPNCNLHDVFK